MRSHEVKSVLLGDRIMSYRENDYKFSLLVEGAEVITLDRSDIENLVEFVDQMNTDYKKTFGWSEYD